MRNMVMLYSLQIDLLFHLGMATNTDGELMILQFKQYSICQLVYSPIYLVTPEEAFHHALSHYHIISTFHRNLFDMHIVFPF